MLKYEDKVSKETERRLSLEIQKRVIRMPKSCRSENMTGRKKAPYENTKGQASFIFRSFKFTAVTFSRTEFSVDSYTALCLCSIKILL